MTSTSKSFGTTPKKKSHFKINTNCMKWTDKQTANDEDCIYMNTKSTLKIQMVIKMYIENALTTLFLLNDGDKMTEWWWKLSWSWSTDMKEWIMDVSHLVQQVKHIVLSPCNWMGNVNLCLLQMNQDESLLMQVTAMWCSSLNFPAEITEKMSHPWQFKDCE